MLQLPKIRWNNFCRLFLFRVNLDQFLTFFAGYYAENLLYLTKYYKKLKYLEQNENIAA